METREKDKAMEMPSSVGFYTLADPPRRRRSSATAVHQTQDHHQNAETHKPTTSDTEPDPDPVSTAPAALLPRSYPRSLPIVPVPHHQPGARYRECQRNHAASSGGHVIDGCGEFMPAGEEGTPESLKCAACECHRSFHRKEVDGERVMMGFNALSHCNNIVTSGRRSSPQRNQNLTPIQPSPIMMSFGGGGAPAESSTEDLNVFHYSLNINGIDRLQQPKKRFRTKFNQEQKEKMLEFADKIGWRINKQDEEEVQRFCSQINVKRQVFKVWMHNNKQAARKKQM